MLIASCIVHLCEFILFYVYFLEKSLQVFEHQIHIGP